MSLVQLIGVELFEFSCESICEKNKHFHPKVDCDGDGKISLDEYFGIFEEHGIVVTEAETER